jgi:Mce-associated membrane protein
MTDLKIDGPTTGDELDTPDAEPATEATEPADIPRSSTRSRRRPSALVVALAVALVAAIAIAGVFAYQLEHRRSLDTSRAEAVDTARTFAVTLFTYSADTFDSYVDDVLSGATGSLAATFTETSSDLQATLVEAGATSSAQVLDIAAESTALDRVEVLVIIDQSASNATVTEPRQAVNAVVMTLERQEDGRWLTSDVANPSAPG